MEQHKNLTAGLVREAMLSAHEKFTIDVEGKNADYIPYLAGVDTNLFGITAVLMTGEVINVGDVEYRFGIESISKVSTALLAMNQHGAETMLHKIGADATGLPFNSMMAMLIENDHPSTPLVNAGAIAACSMVSPEGSLEGKWNAILGFMRSLTSSDLHLIEELYRSESETNFNNKSIAWLLKSYDKIFDDVDLSLDLYTRQCSVGISTQQLAIMAATIAHSGVNPLSNEQVYKPSLSAHIISMMATVGMYERSGDWMFETGMPAKSGVGGAIMGVIPGVMGIAAFSPQLDETGNSVRAQMALSYLSNRLNLNVYSPYRCTIHQHEYVYV
ncbi:MAG: glutaminase A [Rikenellaceae bacterium]